MKFLHKILGIFWIVVSLVTAYYIVSTSVQEIRAGEPADAVIFWPIIIFIFLPILFGLSLFGFYSLSGEYSRLESNTED